MPEARRLINTLSCPQEDERRILHRFSLKLTADMQPP
jgi:hypothetical protein